MNKDQIATILINGAQIRYRALLSLTDELHAAFTKETESMQQQLDEANKVIEQQKAALAEFIEKSACIGRVN